MMKKIFWIVILQILFACNQFPEPDERHHILQVIPNPSGGDLQVLVWNESSDDYQVRVYDPTATEIFDATVPSGTEYESFYVFAEKVGQYHVVVETGNEIISRKAISL